jgi:hypothetical protein
VEPSFSKIIADYLDSVAVWRQRRSLDEPFEPRHKRAVAVMDRLVAYVRSLPDDDERIQMIGRATLDGQVIVPGPILANAVARFGFFEDESTEDGLVQKMAELAFEDLGQVGRDPLRDLPF